MTLIHCAPKLDVGDLLIDKLTGNRGLLQRRYQTNADKTKIDHDKEKGAWAWEIHWFRKGMKNMILNVHTVRPKPQIIGFRHYAEDALIQSIVAGEMILYKVKFNEQIQEK